MRPSGRTLRASRALARGAALVASVALGWGCAGPPAGAPRPVTVRALFTHEPASLSLVGKSDLDGERLAVQITDSLVQYDAQMRYRPRVAESWEFSDGGRTLTFHLRDGVRWQDGSPVTAADVVFSVEQVRDPGVESLTWAPLFHGLESVAAPDERTVRARYAAPDPDALEAWRVPLLPSRLAERGAALLTGRFAEHPVGCGPFRFERYAPGEQIVLAANDDYWDGRPAIDRLVLPFYPDERTALEELLAGNLHVMPATPDLWRAARADERAGRIETFVYYRTSVWLIRFNQDGTNPFFTDARVRRALIEAVDREQFVREMLSGLGRVAATTYHPDLPWNDPEVEPLPYDPGAAERLLDEAGWVRARDGVRSRAGTPFRFTLMIAASSQPIVDQMAAWLQQSWAEIGVRAEIEKLEWGQYRERRDSGRYHAAMGGLSTSSTPDQYELYHSTMREGGVNFMSFADDEVDRLLERGRAVIDPDERLRVYRKLQRRLSELQPVGCLLNFATPVLHDARLRGIEPSPLDYWRTTRGPRVWYWADED